MDDRRFNPHCSHPGCHEQHGPDDPFEYEQIARTRGECVAELLRRANEHPAHSLRTAAYLSLSEAMVRGEGGREAFRRIRVALLHGDSPALPA